MAQEAAAEGAEGEAANALVGEEVVEKHLIKTTPHLLTLGKRACKRMLSRTVQVA